MSWFHEAVVRFWPSLLAARLETVGTVGDAGRRDDVEQLFVKSLAEINFTFTVQGDQWLESL